MFRRTIKMRSKLTIILLLSIFLIGCDKEVKRIGGEKEVRRFDVEDIRLQDYPVLTDTAVIRELIYNNLQISGWVGLLDWRYPTGNDLTIIEYREQLKRDFDDFFWERIDRAPLKNGGVTQQYRYLVYLDSMTYRIIDTVKLKKNYGILILKNDEESYIHYKRLYLAVYNQGKENIETYLIGKELEVKNKSRSEEINIYSNLCNERWLTIYFKAKNYGYFDSLYTRHTYDLHKLTLLRADTIFDSEKEKRKNKKGENRIPEILID